MLKVLALLIVTSSFTAFGAPLPTCKIATLNDASKCMKRVAKVYPEYEEANESFVSVRKDLLKKVLIAISDKEGAAAVDGADFVGAMVEHGDEHHLYYFLMKKGTSKPVELYDLNLVDLASMLVKPVTAKDMFLGTNFDGSDIQEEIEEAIKEAKENF